MRIEGDEGDEPGGGQKMVRGHCLGDLVRCHGARAAGRRSESSCSEGTRDAEQPAMRAGSVENLLAQNSVGSLIGNDL